MDTAVQDVVGVIDEAGSGGHLNEDQFASVEHLFATLAQVALGAFHESQDIPITQEEIAKLLPDAQDVIERVTAQRAEAAAKVAEDATQSEAAPAADVPASADVPSETSSAPASTDAPATDTSAPADSSSDAGSQP